MKWGKIDAKILIFTKIKQIRPLFYRLKRKFLISNIIGMVHRQISGDYQRLAYIINDYQGVHFERLSF